MRKNAHITRTRSAKTSKKRRAPYVRRQRPLHPEGEVYKDGDLTIVRFQGDSSHEHAEGTELENPDAPEEKRIYRKVFKTKTVYLPHELESARKILIGTDSITLGITGYSVIKDQNLLEWGVAKGAYEAACKDLIANMVLQLRGDFPGVNVRFVHGASEMRGKDGIPQGVDSAIINLAREFNDISQLGHSCPNYMMWVPDDDIPVWVANTAQEYSDTFVANLDILLSAGGRQTALRHDLWAALQLGKCMIPIDVIGRIAKNPPPARDHNNVVQDATRAFEECIFPMPHVQGTNLDTRYTAMVRHVREVCSDHARTRLLSPDRAFSTYKSRA